MKKRPPYTIILEDPSLIAVSKDSGVAVGSERWEPDAPGLDKLLEQFLLERDGRMQKLFTVHRIDKETSGLVVLAKTAAAHRKLSSDFRSRRVEKTYTAVVHGTPSWPGGEAVCDLPLLPDGNKKHSTIIDKYHGKPSRTSCTLLLSAGNCSVIEARPETGRTHQIRVHLAALGHPVLCDRLYGKAFRNEKGVYLSSLKRNWRGDAFEERPLLARLALHALKLVLPGDGAGLCLQAPLARDMAALIRQMEKLGAAGKTGTPAPVMKNPQVRGAP
ncbi:MAG: RNA pseudouridine synthase [Treponema sp.]|nr:RNA pseudouridine synthase [Treponema sp.]